MAYRHRYVDPDATGSATGTSWANAYTSLNTAENTEDDSGDIRATGGSNEIVVFHCRSSSGTADSAAVDISGWLTDSGGYIVVVCDATGDSYGGGETDSIGGRHGGVWTTSKYRLEVDVTGNGVLILTEEYIRLSGLQVRKLSGTGHSQNCIHGSSGLSTGVFHIDGCLIRGVGGSSVYEFGIGINDVDTTTYIWNCAIWNISTYASWYSNCISGIASMYVYSCTCIGGYYCIRSTTNTTTVKNTYAGNSLAEDFYRHSGTLVKVNCASDDASADDDNGSTETASNCVINATYSTSSGAYFTNVTAGSEDFRISSASSALVNAGTTLTDNPPGSAALGVDIAGQTRA